MSECQFCRERKAVQTVNIHGAQNSFLADLCYECFLRGSRSLHTDTERDGGGRDD